MGIFPDGKTGLLAIRAAIQSIAASWAERHMKDEEFE